MGRHVAAWVFIVAAWSLVSAQVVPVSKEPHHRIVYEDASLRVLDVVIAPGDTTLDHGHDHDIATVSIGPADARIRPLGGEWGAARRRPLGDTNTAEYAGKPGTHAIQNVGSDQYRLIAVENVKKSGWQAVPVSAAAGVTLLTQGRAFRASALQLTGGQPLERVHAVPSVVVLVSGEVSLAAAGHEPQRLSAASRWGVVGAGRAFTVSAGGTGHAQMVEVEVW